MYISASNQQVNIFQADSTSKSLQIMLASHENEQKPKIEKYRPGVHHHRGRIEEGPGGANFTGKMGCFDGVQWTEYGGSGQTNMWIWYDLINFNHQDVMFLQSRNCAIATAMIDNFGS